MTAATASPIDNPLPSDPAAGSPQGLTRDDPFFASLARLPPLTEPVKVVREGPTRALFEAERRIKDAQDLAANIVGELSATLQEGKEAGYADGRAEAQRELAAELHRVERQAREFYDDAVNTIADLAVEIASRVIGAVPGNTVLVKTVREAINRHTGDDPYFIQVASDAAIVVEDALTQLKSEHPELRLPLIRVDARLPSGRAMLLTRFGSVDLDVESQLKAIHDSLTASKVARDERRMP